MKKSFFVLVCFLMTLSAYSQIASGVKGGVVFSNLAGFDADGQGIDSAILSTVEEGRTGFFAGFFVGIPIFNEKLSFQPEFQYVQQGSNSDILRVDYLQLPLAINYKFSEKFYGNIGPQVGLRIFNSSNAEFLDAIDYSLIASLGYDITANLFVEVRYSLGFNDIAQEGANIPSDLNSANTNLPPSPRFTNSSFTNSYFYFGIGYRIF